MKMIEYKTGDTVVARMTEGLPATADEAAVIAQKYLKQMGSIESAHVYYPHAEWGTSERVVRRATEWQKRN